VPDDLEIQGGTETVRIEVRYDTKGLYGVVEATTEVVVKK